MHWLAPGLAFVLAAAIIVIGLQYVLRPRAATRSFGLPLPEEGPRTDPWLRLKGVRDIASGLTVLGFLAWGHPQAVGLILLIEATIAVGDMLVILAARGSTRLALGMHGVTALVMVLDGLVLMMGGR
ncbi:DUF4267 domain-containing protein [Acidisoma sp. 7E03]